MSQVLLQGGAEMQEPCRGMDEAFLHAAPDGPLVVLLGAATPGGDHDRAAARARRYYGYWERDVLVTPHPEVDADRAAGELADAAVVVMPGGSPARLLDALLHDDGRLARVLRERLEAGASVSGSSAGAMVLAERTARPGGRRSFGDGLGWLPGMVLPHYDGARGAWADPDRPDGPRWGLPEHGGIVLREEHVVAVGEGQVQLLRGERVTELEGRARPLTELLAD